MERSNLTYQLIVDSVPNAIVLTNRSGTITYINRRTEMLFGYEKSQLIGLSIETLLPERYWERFAVLEQLLHASSNPEVPVKGTELMALSNGGREFPIELELNSLIFPDDERMLVMITDITERKKAAERFGLVVESAPNAMVLVNEKGGITMVNGQAEKLFGYDRREMIGSSLSVLIPDRFRNRHEEYTQAYTSKPVTRAMGAARDLFALHKDGTEIEVEIALNPIDTPEGKMVLASIIDITERKNHEILVNNYVEELENKNRELGQFAYIASHDLQEPLRTVSNYVQVFQEDYEDKLDEDASRYLGSINRATLRMSTLIKALLEYSRLGVDKKLALVDINKLITDVIADLQNVIHTTGTTLEVSEMPELMVYETEMRQLFQNLISNAIKFAREGVSPKIRIQSKKQGRNWQFSIADNGIGIDEAHYAKIFHIFQRLHRNSEYEGSGIGLANCKKIVELHKGKIWVDSVPGEGSEFCFNIPAKHGK